MVLPFGGFPRVEILQYLYTYDQEELYFLSLTGILFSQISPFPADNLYIYTQTSPKIQLADEIM